MIFDIGFDLGMRFDHPAELTFPIAIQHHPVDMAFTGIGLPAAFLRCVEIDMHAGAGRVVRVQNRKHGFLTQETTGEYAELRFIVPPKSDNRQRTLFLHSKGYYELLRDFEGKADITMLEGFRKPLSFATFARDLYVEMNW